VTLAELNAAVNKSAKAQNVNKTKDKVEEETHGLNKKKEKKKMLLKRGYI
jgi:hypothetical protein